jgi:hypothetical protein
LNEIKKTCRKFKKTLNCKSIKSRKNWTLCKTQ